MAAAHTPGPWTVSRVVLNPGRVITRADHATRSFGASVDAERERDTYMAVLAYVPEDGRAHHDAAEAEANARLIAAAPELLAALKPLLFAPATARERRLIEEAKAAISKAEGA